MNTSPDAVPSRICEQVCKKVCEEQPAVDHLTSSLGGDLLAGDGNTPPMTADELSEAQRLQKVCAQVGKTLGPVIQEPHPMAPYTPPGSDGSTLQVSPKY